MKPKNYSLLIIIIALLVIVLSGWYIFRITKVNKSEVDAIKEKIIVVPSDILSNSTVSDLNSFKQNGILPVKVTSGMKGRENPFANY